jgi:hypothetical protein
MLVRHCTFVPASGLHTCVLKQVVHDLHNATGVLNDRDIGALDHFQGAVLKAIYRLEIKLVHDPNRLWDVDTHHFRVTINEENEFTESDIACCPSSAFIGRNDRFHRQRIELVLLCHGDLYFWVRSLEFCDQAK